MTWMWTGDEEKDRKLAVAYENVIHITKWPYFLGEEYNAFLHEVWVRLREPPFYSNLSSVDQVSQLVKLIHFLTLKILYFRLYIIVHAHVNNTHMKTGGSEFETDQTSVSSISDHLYIITFSLEQFGPILTLIRIVLLVRFLKVAFGFMS